MKKQILAITIVLVTIITVSSCKKTTTSNSSSFVLVQDSLQGSIVDGEVVLRAGLKYKLIGPLVIKNGATLTIEAGATIEAQTAFGASNLFISVERGGKLNANGTVSSPVIFTSTRTAFGSWGGICIHGKAPNNVGVDAASEINGTQYGGADATDNSGSMTYCIIRNTGAKNGDKEFNGMSFFSVGSGSIYHHIAIFNGGDDAFEWYGGTVNGSYLYAENNDDDNFDYDLGYVGTLENLYSINTNTNASSDSRGIEADNHPTAFASLPYSNPVIKNVSVIGRGATATQTTGSQKEGIFLRRGVKSNITNAFVQGYSVGIGVQHDETIANLTAGSLKVTNVQYTDVTTKTKGTSTANTAVDVSAVATEATNTGAGNGASKPTWANWF